MKIDAFTGERFYLKESDVSITESSSSIASVFIETIEDDDLVSEMSICIIVNIISLFDYNINLIDK